MVVREPLGQPEEGNQASGTEPQVHGGERRWSGAAGKYAVWLGADEEEISPAENDQGESTGWSLEGQANLYTRIGANAGQSSPSALCTLQLNLLVIVCGDLFQFTNGDSGDTTPLSALSVLFVRC